MIFKKESNLVKRTVQALALSKPELNKIFPHDDDSKQSTKPQ